MVLARDIGGVHFHHADPPAAPKPRQLPGDARGFVNRTEELDRLTAVLADADGDPLAVSVSVIAGTAGSGKTTLALRWAHQVQDRFPDGQLYVNLRGYDPGQPLQPHEVLHRFLTALGIPSPAVPADPEAAAALFRSCLADRRVLVVLDNAATAAQVRPLLPGSPGCLALVTSRNRLLGLSVRDGAHRLTLGTLPEPEAVALLRTVTAGFRPQDDAGKLAELARLCAGLPLALRIAGERALSHPHMRLDDLIAELRDESALWHALSAGEDDGGGDDAEDTDAVRTVFAWSYRALPKPAARLFRLLGLHPGPDVSLGAAAALAGTGVVEARQTLDTLVGAHLLEQNAPDRYEFHDLLRAYAAGLAQREEPAESRGEALRRVLGWYLHSAAAARRWINPVSVTPRLRLDPGGGDAAVEPASPADYDEAVDWSEREHANLLAATRAAAEAGLDRLAWQLSVVHWDAWTRSGPIATWLRAADLGLLAVRRLGDERAGEAELLDRIGKANAQSHRHGESLAHHRQAVAIRRELGDRLGEAMSLNALGLAHLRGRHLEEGAAAFEEALRAFRELGDDRWQATTLANLASTHYRAGRLAEAAALVEEALAAHRALNSERGEGNALRVLSDIQRERGETEEALRTAERAVEIALRLRNRVLEGFWLLTLGEAQAACGRLGEALESYQRSADLHRRVGDRSREALAWQGTGETYRRTGRSDEAAAHYARAAAVHRELGDRWDEAVALAGLAAALRGSDPDRARSHRREALGLTAAYGDPRAAALRERIEREASG
ncbi:ATP-binding protein [Streptomyces sp. 6N223]|uniref:ATP-binding protein n=1 Tax=Streptomyces sp. 6N223 TaxID=3457412 RepID=UPI003FD182EC